MGQAITKFKKGDKKEQIPAEPPGLSAMLDEEYKKFKDVKDFHEFYHQFYSIIETLNTKGGAMQFQLPKEEELKKRFEEYHTDKNKPLTKDEFKKIMTALIKLDSLSIGPGAMNAFFFLFGVPVVALLAKRVIPGTQSIPDDVVIPFATSSTVLALTKLHKL